MTPELRAAVDRVKIARNDLKLYVEHYGRSSGGAQDRRERLRKAEKSLLDLAMKLGDK